MAGARRTTLPLDHLEAELAAFPLASEAAFELALIELHPLLSDPTGKLWRRAERELFEAWPGVGLDECVALRDRLWFRELPGRRNNQPVSLGEYLRSLAFHALEQRGDIAVPRLVPDLAEVGEADLTTEARQAWRWLTFALPPDLLLAALSDSRSRPSSVDTVHPVLTRMLADRTFAESHLHLGAALDFRLLWVATLRALAGTWMLPKAFESPGACLEEGRLLGPWLVRAAIARYILASFLQTEGRGEFRKFLQRVRCQLTDALGAAGTAGLATALHELAQGRFEPWRSESENFRHPAAVYRRLVSHMSQFPEHLEEVWAVDPIAPLVRRWTHAGLEPEFGFVAASLTYLDEMPEDKGFARLFWQTIRVRCLFYRHVVSRPLTPGLQWFMRHFDRMKPGRQLVSSQLKVKSALRLGGWEAGLRSLEVRDCPEPTVSENAALVRALADVRDERRRPLGRVHSPLLRAFRARTIGAESSRSPPVPELGLVLHFQRARGESWRKGRPYAFWRGSHSDPSSATTSANDYRDHGGNPSGFRYSRFYRARRREARALARYLQYFPASLYLVRGLDLCADETGVPTWVVAPLMRHVRDAGEAASWTLAAWFGRSVRPLRTTVHAGEDFIHLLTGLRNIGQAIERFDLRPGDRIGHALALGVDVETWARNAGRIAMAREDRLFDLLWEWRYYARGDLGSGERADRLHREIAIHTELIFDMGVEPRILEQMDDRLHDNEFLRLVGFPTGVTPPDLDLIRLPVGRRQDAWPDLPTRLAVLFLRSAEVFERGRQIVRIDPQLEVATLCALQKALRARVAESGFAIEVNPSSNLLVGHLAELQHHPLWRLHPPIPQPDLPALRICVGSDDPVTFSTRLVEEFQLLADALQQGGCSDAEAHAWIDKARQTGLDARFTLPRDVDPLPIEPWSLAAGPPVPLPP